MGVEFDAFVAEGFGDDCGGCRGRSGEDLFAALDLDDFAADAAEELGEFAGDNPCAEDDDAGGDKIEFEHLVAGPCRDLIQAGNWGCGDDRAGGDHELIGGECFAVVEHDCVGGDEASALTEESEAIAFELIAAVVGEFADDIEFALVEGFHVHRGFRDMEAELFALLGQVEDFGGVDEGFRRHAAAQDAEAAEGFGIIDDGDAIAGFACGAGGGVTTAAATDDEVVEMLGIHDGVSIPVMDAFVTSNARATIPKTIN